VIDRAMFLELFQWKFYQQSSHLKLMWI